MRTMIINIINYNYVQRLIVYRDGWRNIGSKPRNEDVDGAHTKDPPMDGTADGSTTWIHWRMKLPCLVSCVFPTWFMLHDLIKLEYFSTPAWRTTPQTEHSKEQDAENGAHQGYTAGLRSLQQVSNNQISNCIY